MNLPKSVRVIEVGPRAGFQIERSFIPTETKVELIDALIRTGIKRIEATSFISAKAIPQMRDAEQVMAAIVRRPGVQLEALSPTRRELKTPPGRGLIR